MHGTDKELATIKHIAARWPLNDAQRQRAIERLLNIIASLGTEDKVAIAAIAALAKLDSLNLQAERDAKPQEVIVTHQGEAVREALVGLLGDPAYLDFARANPVSGYAGAVGQHCHGRAVATRKPSGGDRPGTNGFRNGSSNGKHPHN